jgi:hypothetical protein
MNEESFVPFRERVEYPVFTRAAASIIESTRDLRINFFPHMPFDVLYCHTSHQHLYNTLLHEHAAQNGASLSAVTQLLNQYNFPITGTSFASIDPKELTRDYDVALKKQAIDFSGMIARIFSEQVANRSGYRQQIAMAMADVFEVDSYPALEARAKTWLDERIVRRERFIKRRAPKNVLAFENGLVNEAQAGYDAVVNEQPFLEEHYFA